jgi:hypothetical protein
MLRMFCLYRITGFEDFVQRLELQLNIKRLRNWTSFHLQVREETPTLLGSLVQSDLNHWRQMANLNHWSIPHRFQAVVLK